MLAPVEESMANLAFSTADIRGYATPHGFNLGCTMTYLVSLVAACFRLRKLVYVTRFNSLILGTKFGRGRGSNHLRICYDWR